MTVAELIETLETYNPEATVLIMTQQNWPFENLLQGVVGRQELQDFEQDDEEAVHASPEEGTSLEDVFLVEGHQLRYGNRNAWEAVAFGCLH